MSLDEWSFDDLKFMKNPDMWPGDYIYLLNGTPSIRRHGMLFHYRNNEFEFQEVHRDSYGPVLVTTPEKLYEEGWRVD
jgi:hypothetical protein